MKKNIRNINLHSIMENTDDKIPINITKNIIKKNEIHVPREILKQKKKEEQENKTHVVMVREKKIINKNE